VTAALKLSSDVDVLVAGKAAKGVADAAAKISGVRKVLLAESDELGEGLAESMEALVVPLMSGYDAVLTPATSQGKNFSPRIGRQAGRRPDLRDRRGGGRQHLRAADLRRHTRWRPCSLPTPRR